MPTILRIGPYRFFFYSNEGHEPPHIHVESADGEAKFWLDPPELARSFGLGRSELGRIRGMVTDNRDLSLAKWTEYFHG
jgi:Domain of unknown function (DUF4160)